ncbi:MAG: hypothetical protein ACW98I_19980 [Candidatus Hodarchaeales archaeon]|jgi:hypothetical protein
MHLENNTRHILIDKNFRLIIPFCLLPPFAILWILNKVDPIYAIFSSLALSSLLYLILNLNPFWKSLILGIISVFLLINLYLTILISFALLFVTNGDIQFLSIVMILFLLNLGDSIVLVSVFRQARTIDFNDIIKQKVILGTLLVFGQILYFNIVSLLFNKLSWFFS